MDNFNFSFRTDGLFSSLSGQEVLAKVEEAILDFDMASDLKKGVVVGFSGGADSVLLLLALRHLRDKYDFELGAIHVNHGIRGDEANYDQSFSEAFCRYISIPFFSVGVEVPLYSKNEKIGLEEAARVLRYEAFEELIGEREEYNTVATAHNATDNVETVVFNMLRGSGAKGLSGIAPKRDKFIRPLIYLPKEIILACLSESGIPYVTDSTNNSIDYTRNYIRHKILPEFKAINSNPEASVTKITAALRDDESFISGIAEEFIEKNYKAGRLPSVSLSKQPKALLSRILKALARLSGAASLERVHIVKISELLQRGGNFSLDTPGGFTFVSEFGFCYFENKENRKEKLADWDGIYPLSLGVNEIEDLSCVVTLSYDDNEIFSSNVYNFSIQVKLPFDIMIEDLYIRTKKDGDSYIYGGMTRKLKKLFADKKLPMEKRNRLPILCDKRGILWIPGFGIRGDGLDSYGEKPLWVTVYTPERLNNK